MLRPPRLRPATSSGSACPGRDDVVRGAASAGAGGGVQGAQPGDAVHGALAVHGLDGQHRRGTRRRAGPAGPRTRRPGRRSARTSVPRQPPGDQRRCAPRCPSASARTRGRASSSTPPAMNSPSSTMRHLVGEPEVHPGVARCAAARRPPRTARPPPPHRPRPRSASCAAAPPRRRGRPAGSSGVLPAARAAPARSRIAARQASAPLSSADAGAAGSGPRACSRVSQVSTPLPTGVRSSSATRVSPAVTASQTYSKCGVPPRITTPSATTASWSPGQLLADHRQLDRARHPHHGRSLDAGLARRGQRPLQQRVDDRRRASGWPRRPAATRSRPGSPAGPADPRRSSLAHDSPLRAVRPSAPDSPRSGRSWPIRSRLVRR